MALAFADASFHRFEVGRLWMHQSLKVLCSLLNHRDILLPFLRMTTRLGEGVMMRGVGVMVEMLD